ncbi:hypothetical protein AOQ84DRAFT_225906 [Glonium stellatum]|uniref:Uncharacterized protein n=1 Tax=Glonium stellatum TaxID=574774 RepID=A0A8E2JP73_9PEZI|nr:hypothetical protein AOQ84DRAFT_225906 [Glonium stellatum]
MQAAAYINENGIPLLEYLLLLEDQEQNVIELLSEDFEDEGREMWLKLLRRVGLCLIIEGRHYEAEKPLLQAVEMSKRMRGTEHRDTLNHMENLAYAFLNQGRWKEAEELQVQVVEARIRVLGQEHLDTLCSTGNLAVTFLSQGRWKEAEELQVQVMETRIRVLGQEHPDILGKVSMDLMNKFIRERFYVDLDSDQEEDSRVQIKRAVPAPPLADFIGDIKERTSTAAKPPAAPTLKGNATGFPAHKKRAKTSAFKQQRALRINQPPDASILNATLTGAVQSSHGAIFEDAERKRIDEENRQRIAEMSPEEIERERQELFEGLSPGLIQKLLARANLDDGRNEQDFDSNIPTTDTQAPKAEPTTKKVTFDTSNVSETSNTGVQAEPATNPTTGVVAKPPQPIEPSAQADATITNEAAEPPPPSIHFPLPPQPPEIDPSSPSFLTDLHDKYFPNLPYDPSSLAWMAPIDSTDASSPYHPSQRSLSADQLRFSFRGTLLPPRLAREIPVTKGLHHHADAPEAAGYTVPELARLARSKVPAQRCLAYQTLGRILYRLGVGEFGRESADGQQKVDGPAQVVRDPEAGGDAGREGEEDQGAAAMATGLWECMEEGRVLDTLMEEVGRERGHLTAKTYAQEALWNWRRGGGRKRKAV